MESQLQDLLAVNRESHRARFALQSKQEGRKTVGLLCSYVPEEIVHAAGMLPWRILGTQRAATPKASLYRPEHTCLYCRYVLESLLRGELEFLDAVVATSWDQDLVRLWDVWKYLERNEHHYIMHLPLGGTETHRKQFRKEVKKFFRFIENLSGRPIGAESLHRSVTIYDEARTLLHRLYATRKRKRPPLSGSQTLALTLSSLLMPVELFIERLEQVLPEIEQRESDDEDNRPRLLVSSDRLDVPDILALVEESGGRVVMDDLDTGGRHFWQLTRASPSASVDQLLDALADRYHDQPANPSMMNWAEQVDQIAAWVREFNVQGVLELPLMYSRSRQMRAPYFKQRLGEQGVPVASFEREYHLSGEGQLRTRVGAFVEMIR
jgi:benzoyl-CoA reductase/2-hydroxyglutaryl-CoA dehydratase subunit BcrC/BadD/HgdB